LYHQISFTNKFGRVHTSRSSERSDVGDQMSAVRRGMSMEFSNVPMRRKRFLRDGKGGYKKFVISYKIHKDVNVNKGSRMPATALKGPSVLIERAADFVPPVGELPDVELPPEPVLAVEFEKTVRYLISQ